MSPTRRPYAAFRRSLALLFGLGACAPSSVSMLTPVPTPLTELSTADSVWVERALTSLTLREKVAQMVMPWVGADYTSTDSPEFDRLVDWVARERVGGLVLSVGLPHSYAAKLNELQRRAPLPLLIASDMENGPGMRMAGIYSLPHLLPQGGGTAFPPVMALGATGSDSLAYALGRVLAEEARAVGVHVVFGPVLDVNANPANPIINTRSFGEDPALVSLLATAYIRGAREGGLMTTGKHFPGHGDAEVDSHIDLPTIRADRAQLDSVDLPPFRAAVAAGIDGIMTGHLAMVGVQGTGAPPATLSGYFMTDLLRGDIGFRGILYTDAMTMGGVAKRYGATEPLLAAVEAGADVLLMPREVHQAIETVVEGVRGGRIGEGRIDDSVRRILGAKARAGLRIGREVELDAVDERVGTRAHTALATTIAARSITLPRDFPGLVPLASATQRVLVINYADATDPVAGRAFGRVLSASGRTVDEVRVDARTTAEEFQRLVIRADSAEVVVAGAYVSPREYTGSVGAHGGFAGFVQAISMAGRPVIAISFGNPYLLRAFPAVPAYLLAWGGGEVSQRAAARALLGETSIDGRLPVSLPPFHEAGEGLQRPGRAR